MKKPLLLVFTFILFTLTSRSQEDFGYRTTDIGAEYQWTSDGMTYNVEMAFNARLHSSFLLRGGYTHMASKRTDLHDGEMASGWGGSIGYRYYTGVIPKRFYIGARIELRNMTVSWSVPTTLGTTKLTLLQPSIETGYTILSNEIFFITPYLLAGPQVQLKSEGSKVNYGEKFNPGAGISAGFRF